MNDFRKLAFVLFIQTTVALIAYKGRVRHDNDTSNVAKCF